MGKIYCSECGSELEDTVKFCSSCGTPVDNTDITPNSNEKLDNNNISKENSINKESVKSNNSKSFTTSKVFLGIAGICIIIFILGIVLIGSSFMNSANDTDINEDTSEPQPFIENIYGIDFSIPGYFTNVESKDYEEDGTGMISCTRTYERPDGTGIAIVVATNPDGWNLNDFPGIDMTVNGHHGKLSSSRDVFGYISGDKLVAISGTSQEEVESIIIE